MSTNNLLFTKGKVDVYKREYFNVSNRQLKVTNLCGFSQCWENVGSVWNNIVFEKAIVTELWNHLEKFELHTKKKRPDIFQYRKKYGGGRRGWWERISRVSRIRMGTMNMTTFFPLHQFCPEPLTETTAVDQWEHVCVSQDTRIRGKNVNIWQTFSFTTNKVRSEEDWGTLLFLRIADIFDRALNICLKTKQNKRQLQKKLLFLL